MQEEKNYVNVPLLWNERRNTDNRVAMTLDNEVKTSKFTHHAFVRQSCIDLNSIPFSFETNRKKVDQIFSLYIGYQMSKKRDDLDLYYIQSHD